MREMLRDKTRDEMAEDLNSLGVRAEMAERGRVEENIQKPWHRFQRSLGVIDILDGPIRWINIVNRRRSKNHPPRWWVLLGIPDERPTSNRQTVKIKTVRRKTFPLFGKVVDVTWKGNDYGTGLINVLSTDESVLDLAKKIGNLEVRSHAKEFQGWILQVDSRFGPTSQDWNTIQKIADYILSSPRSY